VRRCLCLALLLLSRSAHADMDLEVQATYAGAIQPGLGDRPDQTVGGRVGMVVEDIFTFGVQITGWSGESASLMLLGYRPYVGTAGRLTVWLGLEGGAGVVGERDLDGRLDLGVIAVFGPTAGLALRFGEIELFLGGSMLLGVRETPPPQTSGVFLPCGHLGLAWIL
jgi:hypothetical protein